MSYLHFECEGGSVDTLFIDLFIYLLHTDRAFLSCDVLHLCLVILPLTVFSQQEPDRTHLSGTRSAVCCLNVFWITVPLF